MLDANQGPSLSARGSQVKPLTAPSAIGTDARAETAILATPSTRTTAGPKMEVAKSKAAITVIPPAMEGSGRALSRKQTPARSAGGRVSASAGGPKVGVNGANGRGET